MISKNDCYLLLAELKDNGVDTDAYTKELLRSSAPSKEVIKFINQNRQIDLSAFYEKLRKSYNNKKSNLYINIVKEVDEPQKVLTTLSALLTQILLFAKTANDRQMFLKHARFTTICKLLAGYGETTNLIPCTQMLRVIKADLKAMESIR